MISDGCTGFQWLEGIFTIRACCEVHDAGGSDFELLGCLLNNTPVWLGPMVIVVTILALTIGRWLRNKLRGK